MRQSIQIIPSGKKALSRGEVYHCANFPFDDGGGSKDKYFVVISGGIDDIVISLSTSQVHKGGGVIPSLLIKSGKYHFFKKDTLFVLSNTNVRVRKVEDMKKYNLSYLGELGTEDIDNIIQLIISNSFIPQAKKDLIVQ